MDTKVTCPSCGQHLVVDSTAIGQQTNCPTCSRQITLAINCGQERTSTITIQRRFSLLIPSTVLCFTAMVALNETFTTKRRLRIINRTSVARRRWQIQNNLASGAAVCVTLRQSERNKL